MAIQIGAVLSICAGASLGALLRWQLGVWLNHLNPAVPPGTLVANVLGGYLVGVAVAVLVREPAWLPAWSPELRLFVITGFLGGLTTFSTFSAEVVALLQQGRVLVACGAVGAHLAGSLIATAAGLLTVEAWRQIR